MKKPSNVLFIALLFAFQSCTKEIVIDIPEKAPSLVIESVLLPFDLNGPQLGVKIFESISVFDTSANKSITNANVLIYRNGQLFDTLFYDNSTDHFYPFGYGPFQGPVAGDHFRLEATAPGFPAVAAETTIPEKVLLDTVTIDRIGFFDESGSVYSKLSVSFSDPSDEDNFYELVVSAIGEEYKPKAFRSLKTYETFIINEPHYPPETRIDLKNPSRLLFNDKTFAGQHVEMSCYFSANQRMGGEHVLNAEILAVHLRNVSPEYYHFQTTLLHSSYNRQADILYGLGEPLNVASNVESGYGLFASFNKDRVYLDLDTLTVRR